MGGDEPGHAAIDRRSWEMGPIILGSLAQLWNNPGTPDYPTAEFHPKGRPAVRWTAGARPFEMGDGFFVTAHPSSNDWPRARPSSTFEWDPVDVVRAWEKLNRSRPRKVTILAFLCVNNNNQYYWGLIFFGSRLFSN